MPKILINEKDRTNPGAPESYSNYSVLIAGFTGVKNTAAGDEIAADSNGVYEFSSAGDFEATIGLADIDVEFKEGDYSVAIKHYGNRMAYELLSLGYSVIYLPIDNTAVLENESTWEIFKDKASYDFRFVTHGLLESSTVPQTLRVRINDLKNAISELEDLLETEISQDTDARLEIAEEQETAYGQLLENGISNLPGLINPKTQEPYKTLITALYGEQNGLVDDKGVVIDAGATGIIAELAALTALSNKNISSNYITEPVLDTDNNPVPVEGELVFDNEGNVIYEDDLKLKVKVTTKDDDEGSFVEIKTIQKDTGTISKVNTHIANLAKYVAAGANDTNDMTATVLTGRGDCIALIELDENEYNKSVIEPELAIIKAINRMSGINAANGKFCAMTVPSVWYEGPKIKMPGAFHYLACFINSLQSGFKEWYAAAGYTRGVSSYRIANTTVTLGEIAINALEPRNTDGSASSPKFACNVIANFRGSYYLWGNRTAHPIGDAKGTEGDLVASHFLNIRQLCTTIKKQLYVACRRFTFDPNSDTLWFNFVNAIRPTLDNMKADQGIRDYKIMKVPTDKKATLKAKIRIIPIEAVEDFDLEVSLEDSFGETAAVVTE